MNPFHVQTASRDCRVPSCDCVRQSSSAEHDKIASWTFCALPRPNASQPKVSAQMRGFHWSKSFRLRPISTPAALHQTLARISTGPACGINVSPGIRVHGARISPRLPGHAVIATYLVYLSTYLHGIPS